MPELTDQFELRKIFAIHCYKCNTKLKFDTRSVFPFSGHDAHHLVFDVEPCPKCCGDKK
jgi:hypothetical protein